jgi:hypothetical protein
MEKELETLVTKELKVPEETLKMLNLVHEMSMTFFYEIVGVAAAGLALASYAGYELVSAIYK